IKNFGSDDPIAYELVFGHRRRRAALLAGLTEVPIDVRDMTDEEVQRAQLIENIGREDVHPIEEAEGFERLMNNHGVTADQITADTGKSRSYVYGRLKLLKAVPSVREACLRGDIGSEVALLLARLPNAKVQEHALNAIKAQHMDLKDGGKQSYRRIRELLVGKYTLDLATAIFDITDITLLTDTPCANCLDCPDRSGNAPEFEDITQNRDAGGWTKKGNADICTQPDCFERKKKAHLQREAAKLEAQGKTVLDGNKAKQAIDAHGQLKDGYIPLADAKKLGLTKTAQASMAVTIQDPRTGKTIEAVKRKDAVDAGLLQEIKFDKPTSPSSNRARSAEEAEAITEKNKQLLKRVMAQVRCQPRRRLDLVAIATSYIDHAFIDDELLEAVGLPDEAEFRASLPHMNTDDIAQWLLCASLHDDLEGSIYQKDAGKAEALHAAASEYGVPIDEPAETASTQPTAARAQDETGGETKKPAARARGKSESKTKGSPNSGKDQSGSAARAIEGTGDDAGAVDANVAAKEEVDA
uniref:ParB/RepB/Spo0J family partition protein n=1 Tax=Limnohabitans sp. TaxID=1907725 RepID=UPI00286F3113